MKASVEKFNSFEEKYRSKFKRFRKFDDSIRLEQASINSLINQSTDYYNQTMDYTGSFITFLHYQKLGIGIFKTIPPRHYKKAFSNSSKKLNLYIPHQFLNATAKHGELFISNDNYYAISSNALIYGNSTP